MSPVSTPLIIAAGVFLILFVLLSSYFYALKTIFNKRKVNDAQEKLPELPHYTEVPKDPFSKENIASEWHMKPVEQNILQQVPSYGSTEEQIDNGKEEEVLLPKISLQSTKAKVSQQTSGSVCVDVGNEQSFSTLLDDDIINFTESRTSSRLSHESSVADIGDISLDVEFDKSIVSSQDEDRMNAGSRTSSRSKSEMSRETTASAPPLSRNKSKRRTRIRSLFSLKKDRKSKKINTSNENKSKEKEKKGSKIWRPSSSQSENRPKAVKKPAQHLKTIENSKKPQKSGQNSL